MRAVDDDGKIWGLLHLSRGSVFVRPCQACFHLREIATTQFPELSFVQKVCFESQVRYRLIGACIWKLYSWSSMCHLRWIMEQLVRVCGSSMYSFRGLISWNRSRGSQRNSHGSSFRECWLEKWPDDSITDLQRIWMACSDLGNQLGGIIQRLLLWWQEVDWFGERSRVHVWIAPDQWMLFYAMTDSICGDFNEWFGSVLDGWSLLGHIPERIAWNYGWPWIRMIRRKWLLPHWWKWLLLHW